MQNTIFSNFEKEIIKNSVDSIEFNSEKNSTLCFTVTY